MASLPCDGHGPGRTEWLLESEPLVVPTRMDSPCLPHRRIFPGGTGCHPEAYGRMSLEGGW